MATNDIDELRNQETDLARAILEDRVRVIQAFDAFVEARAQFVMDYLIDQARLTVIDQPRVSEAIGRDMVRKLRADVTALAESARDRVRGTLGSCSDEDKVGGTALGGTADVEPEIVGEFAALMTRAGYKGSDSLFTWLFLGSKDPSLTARSKIPAVPEYRVYWEAVEKRRGMLKRLRELRERVAAASAADLWDAE